MGDAGGGENHIGGDHFVTGVDAVQVSDASFQGTGLFIVVAENQLAIDLAAHAFQRRCGQHAFGCATRAHIHIDPGHFAFGAVDHASHVTIGDQADRGAG